MRSLLLALLAGSSAAQAQLFVIRSQVINRVEVPSMGRVPSDGVVRSHPCLLEPLRFRGDLEAESNVTLESGGALVQLRVATRGVRAVGKDSLTEYRAFDVVTMGLAAGMLPASAPAVIEARFKAPSGGTDFSARFTVDLNIDPGGHVMATLGAVELECR